METITEPSKRIPVMRQKDIVVAGGGPSGIVAALSAARNGGDVVLVERYGFLGGNATMYIPVLTFFSVKGEQVIKGIAQEIIDRLIKIGGSIGHIRCPVHVARTPIDPDLLKLVTIEMLQEAGVEIILHTFVVGTLCEGDRIKAIITESKSGRRAIVGKVFLDATGDGDVAVFAGAPYEKGRASDGKMQPPTLTFRMGGVNTQKLREYLIRDPERYSTIYPLRNFEKSQRLVSVVGLRELLKEAKIKEGLSIPNDRTIISTIIRENEVMVNMVRVAGVDGSRAEDLTRGEIEARKQIMEIIKYLTKYVPGFELAFLLDTSHQLGIRESRRIIGDYILTKEDILQSRRFEDVIAVGGYPLDIHDPGSNDGFFMYPRDSYDIPYRCLLPKNLDNLLVVGRSISTTHEALAATRVMATCMAEGEAAGCAAALCVNKGIKPRDLNVKILQEKLLDQGAYLGIK